MLRHIVLIALVPSALSAGEPLVLHTESLPTGAIRRFGIPPQPAAQPVRAGGHAPNGALRILVAQGRDVVVWAWEPVGSKHPAARLSGPVADLIQLVVSGNGSTAAGLDAGGGVHVWDLGTGERRGIRASGQAVTAIALDEKGERVFFAEGSALHVYDQTDQTTRKHGTATADITRIAVQESHIVTADAKGTITLRHHKGDLVGDLTWTPRPNRPEAGQRRDPLSLLGGGAAVKEDPQRPLQYVHEFDRGVSKVAVSPDGKYVAVGGGTVVRVWSRGDRKLLWEHNRHARIHWGLSSMTTGYVPPPQPPRQIGGVWDIAFSRDGKYLATSGLHGDVLLVHADTGKDVRPDDPKAASGSDRPYPGLRRETAFGPDGRTLTTFVGSFSIIQEEIATGKIVNQVSSHRATVTGVTVSPDEKWLATMGDDRRVRLWNLARGECVDDVPAGIGEGHGMAFSPDGKWLCAGGAYHGFSVWQVSGNPPQLVMKGGYDTLSYRSGGFVPGHDARMAVVGPYGNCRLVDLADRKLHPFPIRPTSDALSFSVGGKWVALALGASATPGPQLFGLGGEAGPSLDGREFEGYVDQVRLSPDGRFLFAAGTGGSFVVWETEGGRRYLSQRFGEGRVTVGAFSQDSRVLAVARKGYIHLIETATGRTLRILRADSRGVHALHFTSTALVSAGADGVALLWEVEKELRSAVLLPKEPGRGLGGKAEDGVTTGMYSRQIPVKSHVFSTAFSPDGRTLAVGMRDTVQLFDLKTETEIVAFEADRGQVLALNFSPDGKSLAACGEFFDGKANPVRMWDLATRTQRWARAKTGRQPRIVAFSADSRTLYSAGKGICRWDVATGREWERLDLGEPYALSVALSPDDRRMVVSGMTPEVRVVEAATGRVIKTIQSHDGNDDGASGAHAVAYSPDGKLMATGARDGTVRIWDTRDFGKQAEWRVGDTKHRGIAQTVFSPKGDLLAVVGGPIESGLMPDIEVYDVKTGRLRVRLYGHGPHVSWSPDGRWIASAERHHSQREKHHVRLWDIDYLLGR